MTSSVCKPNLSIKLIRIISRRVLFERQRPFHARSEANTVMCTSMSLKSIAHKCFNTPHTHNRDSNNVCLFACFLACLLVCLFVCSFVCLFVCLLAFLLACWFVCLFVCLFVGLFVEMLLIFVATN